ncbi:MAG: prepilin-type N-terminal cleavage/methylation domain-containing protein [Candidatus Omnitrophica bacterium]|nr:prepilin-type N-terminal cleavage/methylation domain-containing protein [Candidatus Omnitrophota bacterium]
MFRKVRSNRKGFTLIELMTVVIIVGILAAISIPIFRGQVKRARAAEGAALLGSVLTGQRVYYAEHNSYYGPEDDMADLTTNLGVDPTGNKYFTTYEVTAASAAGFTAETVGAGDAAGITVTMTYTNAAGATITYDGL